MSEKEANKRNRNNYNDYLIELGKDFEKMLHQSVKKLPEKISFKYVNTDSRSISLKDIFKSLKEMREKKEIR